MCHAPYMRPVRVRSVKVAKDVKNGQTGAGTHLLHHFHWLFNWVYLSQPYPPCTCLLSPELYLICALYQPFPHPVPTLLLFKFQSFSEILTTLKYIMYIKAYCIMGTRVGQIHMGREVLIFNIFLHGEYDFLYPCSSTMYPPSLYPYPHDGLKLVTLLQH